MLKLGDAQWRELQAHDAREFVRAVCDRFLAGRPELLADPGRAEVFARMQAAHRHAAAIGLNSTPHIVHWLYLAADAPAMLDDAAINAHLRKPGARPEQRLDDLLAVLNHLLTKGG